MKWKQFFPLIALVFAVAIACNKIQNSRERTSNTNQLNIQYHVNAGPETTPALSSVFNSSAGKLFPADTGTAWVNAYQTMFPGSSVKPCTFSMVALQKILRYPGCVGISLSNASRNGSAAVIAQGVNAAGVIINTDSVFTSQGLISFAEAESLKQSFISNSAARIYSEFFSSAALNSFFATATMSQTSQLKIEKGWNTKGEGMVLTSVSDSSYNDVVVEDGAPCPGPGCPTNTK